MKLDSNNHSVFLLYYHLVLVVKYRRKVIDDAISNRLKEIFEYIQSNYNITLQEWNHDKDHGLCQVKVGNDLFILLFYWFTCFEGQCEILILLI